MKKRIRRYLRDGHRRSFFRRFVSILACVVVFCTTYALLLPAITLEKTAACGIEEHQHDDSCYENKLTCGLKETEGHSHSEDCYDIHSQIICKIEEHAHTGDCFDKNGNLTCALEEHTHDSGCFREDRVLSYKKEEAEPHHHSDACYEKVLTCGVGVHTHSASCYSAQGEAEVSMLEEADIYSTGEAESPALEEDIPALEEAEFPEPEKAAASLHFQQMLTDATSLYTLSGGTFAGERLVGNTSPEDTSSEDTPPGETLSGDTTTGNELPEEGEETETDEAVWIRVNENDTAEVHAADTVRLYYAYTIPAGTLDASNAEFRFPLPSNVYLTDEQIETNNAMNDGRGTQALEGTRTPDEAPVDPEDVSAWVTFENVYDDIDNDTYEDIEVKDSILLEQDAVLTFDEYSIEKNRKTYDNDGALISNGEKISGFFSIDVTADQIQFDQNDENLEAQITLVEKDYELDIEPIRRTLRLVEEDETEEEIISEAGNDQEEAAEKETESDPEEEIKEETGKDIGDVTEAEAESDPEEETEEETGKDIGEVTEAEAESDSEEETQAEAGSNSEEETEAEAESISEEKIEEVGENPKETSEAGVLIFKGPDYTVSATYTEDAGIPAGASLVVQEITKETEGFDYEDYCAQAEEAIAQETAESTSWIRLFDISIVTQYGEKLDPQDTVSVQITYREAPAQGETDRLRTVHFAGKEETPQVIGDTSQPIAEPLDQVNFKTNSFSVFAIVGTTIEKTVLASDGYNYKVSVSYGIEADIPDDVKLEVEEILPGNKKGLEDGIDNPSFYDEFIAKTENVLGWEAGSASYARVFDISIVKGEEKVQPAEGTKVDVRIELADAKEQHKLNVVHFADDRDEGDVVANSTENEQKGAVVEFPAEGFSVYVIADHEGGDIITPRVEFHFLDSDYTEVSEGTGYTYSAEPYSFVNKAGEYQTTQILKDGEGLEQITNPRNKTDPDRYFYGWYVVDSNSNPDESPVVYTWTEDPVRIIEETPISISIDGTMVTWTLGEASGSGIVDEDGCIHVYLAPIYEDYYFVNFHIGPKEDLGTEEQPGLAHSLMTRKLIVLGSDGETNVRIGNVQAPSPDAVHKIFAGWETVKSEGGNLITERIYPTLDLEGNEISNPEGEDGYYINVTEEKNIDLYPVYAEARWVYFHTGESGNGATYVGAKYLLTSDDVQPGEENPYYFETMPVSQRNGYNFVGWFTEKDEDENGVGQRITDAQGKVVPNDFVKYDTDGITKLYEIVDGKLYFYKAMAELHLYAKWEEKPRTSYNVIVWRQKVTDNKTASDVEKQYDYYTSETILTDSGQTLEQLQGKGDLYTYQNYNGGEFTGFHYSRTKMNSNTVASDKTTVVNVYYDRNFMTINYIGNVTGSGTIYVYTPSTGTSTTTRYYGLVNGEYVELTRGNNYTTYTYTTQYTYTQNNNPYYSYPSYDYSDRYGIVNGEYIRIYWNNNAWRTENNWNGPVYDGNRYSRSTGTVYIGERFTRSGSRPPYTYTSTDSNTGTQYGIMNGGHVQLNRTSSTEYNWTYTRNGVSYTYNGTRYTRASQTGIQYTGLYGQTLAQNEYTWPAGNWFSGSGGTGSRLTFLDAFIFDGLTYATDDKSKVTLYSGTANTGRTVYFYKQNADGTWPTEATNRVAVANNSNFTITDKYNGFTAYAYSMNGTTYTMLGDPNSNGEYGTFSTSNNLHIRFERNTYNLTFDINYPNLAGVTYSNGKDENRKSFALFEESLIAYGLGGSDYWVPKAPDHYIFDGWYEDATCTVPFNFNSTMPAANKVVYAKWTPETFRVHINPNGAEIDHINHNGTPTFRADLDYYYDDKATYINADYGTSVVEYTLDREYVPISDAVAQTLDPSAVYYYIYSPYYENTGRGLPADLRNALYVTESELDSYYQYYVDLITTLKASNPERYNEVTILGPAAWRNDYVSTQKYRKKYANERYEFLGWFKDDETMPYNFSDPVEESFTLTAHWRLDGGYSVMYTPEFIMPDGTLINGNIESLQDPQGDAAYADQATTTILHQPTALTANGAPVEDDSYIFRGWRLVSIGGTPENPIYVPLEENKYYQEGDVFTIEAKNANPSGIIYLQAVYEEKDSSYRRPEIANLIIDANSGFITTDGETELGANQNLDRIGDVGTVALDAAEDQIIFGDLQSNIAVHVDDYAVDPNYFKHPNGYFLLGFDDEPDEKDYVATYAADSIISVSRTDEETIYAVWEPMVYINFVNNTEVDDVTFGISSEDSNALYVVNLASGTHERVSLTDLGNITVKKGETIRLAVPYGAEKNITISGTNTLGPGQVLLWDSKVTIDNTTYDTADNVTTGYTHSVDENTHSHLLAKGQTDNNEEFLFDESMIVNETGVTVTFTAIQHDRTLVLHDNYRENTQEIYFADSQMNSDAFDLPTPSTRIGYEFVGWDTERLPDNTEEIPDYPVGTDIDNIGGFFGDEQIKTLYAVWKAKAERGETYIYKLVPEPGDQNRDFVFTVSISGSYRQDSNNSVVSLTSNNNTSGNQLTENCTLSHGQYLVVTTSKEIGVVNTNGKPWIQAVIQKYDKGEGQSLETKTVRWESPNNILGTVTFDNYTFINVTENDYRTDFYNTELEKAAETQPNVLIMSQNDRRVRWTNTDAGGTVFYNNIRQTADVSVKKNLVGSTAAGAFSYSAGYTLEDVTTDLGTFTVSSTSETGYILEKIPVGAVLTITEAEDNSYEVSTVFEKGSTDTDNASNIVSFNVPNGGETVTYTNILKSYPVRIVKVNQDGEADLEHGNGVEARFDMSQDGSNIVSGKYTTPTDNVVFDSAHDGNLSVGTYTLTETWTQPGYLGLNAPVTLTLRGDGTLTSDTSEAVVTGNETEGFVVSVINRATKNVTVRKILKDPLVSQRTFKFTATYTIGNVTEAFPDFSILSSNDLSGTHILTVPVGATLDVTEDSTGLTDVYTTQVAVEGENSTTSNTITINNVQNTAELTFTNTRKTAQITVVKQMSDETDELSFPFTAILKNGATPIEQYLVYTVTEGGNEIEHKTDHSGQVPFELSHGQSQVLTVPAGAVLVLSETTNDYIADITSTTGASDADSDDNSFTLTVTGDDRITFLNQPKGASVLLRKIGYDNRDESFWILQGATFKIYTDSDKSNGSLVTLDGRSEFTSDEEGLLYEGLIPAGTYYLDETNVPAGYNSPPGMYVLTVSNGIVTLNSTVTIGTPDLNHWITSETDPVTGKTTYIVSIRNTTGVVLPSTGGPGTDLIYLLGIILTSLAGLGLVMRKRRGAI